MLCVQKISKYFTLSTEASIQITFHICCKCFKKCQSKPNFAFWPLSYTVSAVKKQFTCVFNHSHLASGWTVLCQCVIKDPGVIWYASKCSVLRFNWKSCEMQFLCQTTLLLSSFRGKYFCQLPLTKFKILSVRTQEALCTTNINLQSKCLYLTICTGAAVAS